MRRWLDQRVKFQAATEVSSPDVQGFFPRGNTKSMMDPDLVDPISHRDFKTAAFGGPNTFPGDPVTSHIVKGLGGRMDVSPQRNQVFPLGIMNIHPARLGGLIAAPQAEMDSRHLAEPGDG